MPPLLPAAAKAATARSITARSRVSTGRNSTPSDGAAACSAPNSAVPAGLAGSRRTMARVTCGATCLRSSSHLPLILYSKFIKPVVLPPGRARLSTKPAPTGSETRMNTIGTVRVAFCNASTPNVPAANRTSGASATSSAAYLRSRSGSFSPQRTSIRTLRPSLQPSCRRPSCKATRPLRPCASAGVFESMPIRRIFSGCCARAASGHAATDPAITLMN